MFNEEQIIHMQENNTINNEPVTLPEPNETEVFEKGVNPGR